MRSMTYSYCTHNHYDRRLRHHGLIGAHITIHSLRRWQPKPLDQLSQCTGWSTLDLQLPDFPAERGYRCHHLSYTRANLASSSAAFNIRRALSLMTLNPSFPPVLRGVLRLQSGVMRLFPRAIFSANPLGLLLAATPACGFR
jgi:hypothetical protein